MTSATFVRFLLRHSRAITVCLVLLAVVSGVRTVRTYANLRSDLEELLPANAPAVAALAEARARLPGLRHLGVVVDTGGPEHAKAALTFLSDLERRVLRYPGNLVSGVRSGIAEERRFVETHGLQLMRPADVKELREAVEARHRWEVAHATGLSLFSDEEEPPPPIPVDALEKKYVARFGRPHPFPDDRFLSDDGKTAVLVIRVGSQATGIAEDERLLELVRTDVQELGFPAAYAAGMRVGYAGDVATRVEEARGLAADLGTSGAVVLALVLAAIAWFYRSFAAVPVLALPVVFGALYTFGLVALPPLGIVELNSNTAFLSSIIVGNGVNSGIILLARFREQTRLGDALEPALVTAVRETYRPTLGAAVAASAAYGSLLLTDFRGFAQFGWIGALGMLVCWATTFVFVPPLVRTFGRFLRTKASHGTAGISPRLTAVVLGRPRWVLGVGVALAAICVLGLARRRSDWLETDFSRLRRADSFEHGERYWGKRMDSTLRTYLTPAVMLTDSKKDAERAAAALRGLQRDGRAGGLIASIRTSEAVLPSTRAEALEEAKKLRQELTPTMLAALSPPDRARVERLLSDEALTPLTDADVPAALAAGLRDKKGHIDRNVLVFPKLGAGTWDAGRMQAFTRGLRRVAHDEGNNAVVVGALLLSTDIIDAMRRDGPIATGAAMAFVLLVAVLAFRSFGLSLAAMASLLFGVLLMLGTAAWSGQRLNFSNLIALPITFGVAADYSINVLRRYQAGGDLAAAMASTGGAVALCSATTVIGFGSLLIAQNRALSSFGALAVTGELACLGTAVLVLPALLAWSGDRRAPAGATHGAEEHAT